MEPNLQFTQAVTAIKAHDNDGARRLLAEVLRLNPRHEQAWLALASVLTDMHQAVDCLNRVLALNPNNAVAQEWLDFARQEIARQEAVAEMKADLPAAEILAGETDSEQRPVPRLGEYLLDYKFITPEQLTAALAAQRAAAQTGASKRLGDILLEQRAITEERLGFAVREQSRSFYSLFDD